MQKKYILTALIVLGAFSLGGVAFAWSGVWHNPNWISSGTVIDEKKLGESLQYLYDEIEEDRDTLGDLSCGVGQTVRWNGSVWHCSTL